MLDIILKLADEMTGTEERRTFVVLPRGNGLYGVAECPFRYAPPVLYEFTSDIGDTIVIWSTNTFLSEPIAHEIAQRIGDKIGWYV